MTEAADTSTDISTTDTPTTPSLVPADALDALKAKLAKLNKRAGKLGVPEVSVICGETVHNTVNGMVTALIPVTVVGSLIKVSGWSIAGIVDLLVTDTGERQNILRPSPLFDGGNLPLEFRSVDATRCDHCHIRIPTRKATAILHNETMDEFQVVGSTCLKDFLGHDPKALVWQAQMLSDAYGAVDEAMGGGWGSGQMGVGLDSYLTMVAACIREEGWMSRTKAREVDGYASADSAWDQMTDRSIREQYRIIPTASDEGRAEKAMSWAEENLKDADPDLLNDYLYNLRVATSLPYVTQKTSGLVASLVSTAEREEARKIENGVEGQWIGTPGSKAKITLTLTVTYQTTIDSGLYVSHLYKFVTGDGEHLSWFSSRPLEHPDATPVEVGDVVVVTAKVKSHQEYKGVKETGIFYGKVLS